MRPVDAARDAHASRDLAAAVAVWAWGAIVAWWLCRFLFSLGPGETFLNHEMYSPVHRTIEFLDLLRAGYLFPTWAVDFRGGLGSPYFGYYEPGFFYVTSAFAAVLPLPLALAAATYALVLVGYGGMAALVQPRFGAAAAALAGTTLLVSPYVRTDIYGRGDFPELMGMMLLPAALAATSAWLDRGRAASWYGLAVVAAALICAHPVTGLLGYGACTAVVGSAMVVGCDRRRAVAVFGALVAGVGLAAFYLAPIALEWNLVEGGRLTINSSDFRLHFVDLSELLGFRVREGFVLLRPALGPVVLGLAGLGAVLSLWRWTALTTDGRRLVVSALVLVAGTAWLTNPSARPVWEAIPLLAFLQFPWRFLVVLTVALAAVAGCIPRGAPIVMLLGIVLHAATIGSFEPFARAQHLLHPASARGLTAEFVAPDVADEWLPRGAAALRPPHVPTAATCSEGCTVDDVSRDAGRLSARVRTDHPSEVVLPHYWFPVGWTATLDGSPVPIDRTSAGLMRIAVPTGGALEVVFGTTPARRLGVAVSAATLVVLALAWHACARRPTVR